MPKRMRPILAAAVLSAVSAVCAAQAADQPGQTASANFEQQQAAPIERAYPRQQTLQSRPAAEPVEPAEAAPLTLAPGETIAPKMTSSVNPIPGVLLRVGPQSNVKEVSRDAQKLELSVERGLVNVNVHDPEKDMLILVDLPGGQTQVMKNGLYTFNAETDTMRVLKGEALAFPATATADYKPGDKPIKVKEYKKVVFSGTDVRPKGFYPEDARADLLPGPRPGAEPGPGNLYGNGPYGDGFYGYAPYPYPYPYYGYGYPWGYPYYAWGWGYPWGVGIGFGYYGGWGYHGWYRGGWR